MGMLSVALRVVCVATAVLALTYDEQEATLNVQWVRFFFRAQMIYNSITLQLTSFPDSHARQQAGAAYCCGTLGNGCVKWNCPSCHDSVEAVAVSNVSTNANGFVGYDSDHDTIIVSFSGTDPLSIRNWIDDISTVIKSVCHVLFERLFCSS
jgi:hypothetical protein